MFPEADPCYYHVRLDAELEMTVISNAEADRSRRAKEDFNFLVICHAKGNPAMYALFRDRSLDVPREVKTAADTEYESWFLKETQ